MLALLAQALEREGSSGVEALLRAAEEALRVRDDLVADLKEQAAGRPGLSGCRERAENLDLAEH